MFDAADDAAGSEIGRPVCVANSGGRLQGAQICQIVSRAIIQPAEVKNNNESIQSGYAEIGPNEWICKEGKEITAKHQTEGSRAGDDGRETRTTTTFTQLINVFLRLERAPVGREYRFFGGLTPPLHKRAKRTRTKHPITRENGTKNPNLFPENQPQW